MTNFAHRLTSGVTSSINVSLLTSEGHLTDEEAAYLERITEAWNFYEGYHWEGIDDLDKPQVTFNYCRAFINKFVAFELGKGFSIQTPQNLEHTPVTVGDPKIEVSTDTDQNGVVEPTEALDGQETVTISEKTQGEFLNEVWDDNKRDQLIVEIGQTKDITGEAWLRVSFDEPEDLIDPFEEYPNGRIRVTLIPTQYAYPEFDEHDKDKMTSLLIMYPIHEEVETGILFRRTKEETILYKEYWTPEKIEVYKAGNKVDEMENPYGFIPFVQIKNFPIAGHSRGVGDIDDVIPLNVELNTKKSDVSEVIDYHSAPITLVYGAKIGNLEKGANKVWGGLPKDSKVENLALQGDLVASTSYISDVKTAMCEVAGIPETVLGGASAISNTSGVALQYMNLPLIERTRVKRECTKTGLQLVNKMILFVALTHGLIVRPDDVPMKEFVSNTVDIPDTLPKDELVELQKIQQEMMMGIECRHGAMERLGFDNINKKIVEVDTERAEHPELFNPALQQMWYQQFQSQMGATNAGGMMNGQTPQEQLRIAMTGQNGTPQES